VGLLLIRSNSLYFKISGAVVAAAALAPLAFACVSYLTRGRFETDEDLLNRSEADPETDLTSEPAPEPLETKVSGYEALAPRMIAFLGVCVLVGGALVWRLNPQSIGEYLKLSITRAPPACGRSDPSPARLDPHSYYRAAVFVDITDPVVNEYLRERLGLPERTLFMTRAFQAPSARALFPRQSAGGVRGDPAAGRIAAFVPAYSCEETPGASLTKRKPRPARRNSCGKKRNSI